MSGDDPARDAEGSATERATGGFDDSATGRRNPREAPDASPEPYRQPPNTGPTDDRGAAPNRAARRESVTALLSRPAVKHQIKYTLAVFGLLGLGFGLTGFVFTDILIPGVTGGGSQGASASATGESGGSLTGALLSFVALTGVVVVTALSGSIVALVCGLRVADRLEDTRSAYAASGVGTALGYVVMVTLTVLVLSSVAGSSGGAAGGLLSLGDVLVPSGLLALPVALVGLGTVYVADEFEGQAPVADDRSSPPSREP